MIFQRALRRELLGSAGATFTVLFTIILTWTLIRILGQAAGGKVASGDVIALIAFTSLNYLPLILALTSFIAVLLVVTRTYRESEMVVWFASGQSLTAWIRPVLTFGFPIIVVTAVLSFYAGPWAKLQYAEYVERFTKREDLQKVSPGQFKESGSRNAIFFAEGASGQTASVQNVFVNQVDARGTSVIVAKDAVVETADNGQRYLVMKNGRRYQGQPGQADFQTMEFDTYRMQVAQQATRLDPIQDVKAIPTATLVKIPTNQARSELLWRISAPITCFVLLLLAIPLGFVNPRAGSSTNLIIAILIFFTYYNMNELFRKGVEQGRFSFTLGWWPLHLVALLTVLALFLWRLNVNSRWHPRALFASRKRGQGAA
ncbi:LPS export ABC transporter permease LptF [Pseudoduganella albidiflava]|uniref:Lipopolysaccharide export system permease protein LptF n=1 Tax=Pseudoduganella albidiflava TaxID=321983 RepID=A0A411X1X0_9BURK|nr:LPS export ABC transporter permease LptF [Pseudoduganella albidiflava]QBI02971.1 LPS export ABC transporter permease LptF [Pseudoduganella albidiflava]GGY57852.1 LPS export ABC transporter permease LptF [Pseudoduganella albidiflava]